jgi:hypothetical protein
VLRTLDEADDPVIPSKIGNIPGRLKEGRCKVVPQVMAPKRDTRSSGDPDKPVGKGRVTLAIMVPEKAMSDASYRTDFLQLP